MCLSPISIFNPSKYISLSHRDSFMLNVPCGRCSECMEKKHDEWYFRSHYEIWDTLRHGGFVLFDTLTYRNDSLPHISDFVPDIPRELDYPCFNRFHFREFIKRLRRRCEYHGFSPIRYFLTTEYGTDPNFSHRPHAHLLLFVGADHDPLLLSKWIYECWTYGRTDGVYQYGSNYVLENRVFRDFSAHGMQLANYVSKYVQKDSAFDKVISSRINSIVDHYFPNRYDDFSVYLDSKSFVTKLRNIVCQQHFQSQFFGLGYFDSEYFNLQSIIDSGMVKMLVPKMSIYKHIPLPMYYFRHLFCDMVKVAGKRTWVLNDLGKKYRYVAVNRNIDNYARHIHEFVLNLANLNLDKKMFDKASQVFSSIDYKKFSSYVLHHRGRFSGKLDFSNIIDKLHHNLDNYSSAFPFYHYSTNNDKFAFGQKFISPVYLGSDIEGYDMLNIPTMNRFAFAHSHCYFDYDYELPYQLYMSLSSFAKRSKQGTFDREQYLRKLYKALFERV